jgi:hypothetical protein
VTTEFEFGGPLGATTVMISLPLVIVGLYVGCGRNGCASGPASAAEVFKNMQLPQLWDWTAAAVVFGWAALHFALYVLLPGPRVEGVVLRDGSRLKYPINGHLAFWVSLTACIHGLPQLGMSLSWLYDHYLQLAIASCALSALISLYSYAVSFADGCMLAEGGNSRNPLYDFFIGRPLNPRVGLLDLKACCELRPGLIGWAVLNLGMASKQFELTGGITPSMFLVNAFQLVYVWDALYNEQARSVPFTSLRVHWRPALRTRTPSLPLPDAGLPWRSRFSPRWTSRRMASASCLLLGTSRGYPSRTRCRWLHEPARPHLPWHGARSLAVGVSGHHFSTCATLTSRSGVRVALYFKTGRVEGIWN